MTQVNELLPFLGEAVTLFLAEQAISRRLAERALKQLNPVTQKVWCRAMDTS